MASRRAAVAAGVATTALLAAGAAVVVGSGGDDGAADAAASTSTATTEVVRRDLVERESVDGTLGFADERPVVNRRAGTITWLPEPGAVVRPGRRLYEVDGAPVHLLDGTIPMWRDLGPGTEGDDVRQLERNLRALDLDPDGAMDVDGTWDGGTSAAVRRFQERRDLSETGTIAADSVVVQPGARRISAVGATVGAQTGGQASTGASAGGEAFLTTTSTRRLVRIDLDTTKADLAARGASVSVELPDGERVGGTITDVGTVAEAKAGSDGTVDPSTATIPVEVRLRERPGTDLDQAPVDVDLEKQRARDVLAVPVSALIALQDGGFAVEVRDGDARRTVRVETGLSTDAYVEVRGDGLRDGTVVTDAKV